jgi:hypothetical protein
MDEKSLQELMDFLADTEVQRDMVIAERETLKKEQIPPGIQVELESIDLEYADKIKLIEDNIKARKEQLQILLKEWAKSVKSQYYTYSYEPVVEWNAEALDGYALNHPEILWMRKEGKPKTRLTPKKK